MRVADTVAGMAARNTMWVVALAMHRTLMMAMPSNNIGV